MVLASILVDALLSSVREAARARRFEPGTAPGRLLVWPPRIP
jgi:hypothetical protein